MHRSLPLLRYKIHGSPFAAATKQFDKMMYKTDRANIRLKDLNEEVSTQLRNSFTRELQSAASACVEGVEMRRSVKARQISFQLIKRPRSRQPKLRAERLVILSKKLQEKMKEYSDNGEFPELDELDIQIVDVEPNDASKIKVIWEGSPPEEYDTEKLFKLISKRLNQLLMQDPNLGIKIPVVEFERKIQRHQLHLMEDLFKDLDTGIKSDYGPRTGRVDTTVERDLLDDRSK